MLQPYCLQMIAALEAHLQSMHAPEERMFAKHPDEDHIIVSHALFWIMSKPLVKKLSGVKSFLLLRQYEEEMLTAYLTESDDFPELLHACNIIFEGLPYELQQAMHRPPMAKTARRLQAVAIVALGYSGDMPDEQAIDILDDLDFLNNTVYSSLIEEMLPLLQRMVEDELRML